MNITRMLLSIGTMGALLAPSLSMAATDTDLDASAGASIYSDTGFLNSFIDPVDTTNGFDAAFDVRAFTAHPCFSAVGAEQDYCLQLFGVTSDFESLVETDALGRLIIEHALDRRCGDLSASDFADCKEENASLLPQLLIQLNLTGSVLSDADEDEMTEEEDAVPTKQENRRDRMERLWELCAGHEMTQAGCYQMFVGAVDRATISELEELFEQNPGAAGGDAQGQDRPIRSGAPTDDTDADMNDDSENMGDDTDEDAVQSETFDDDAAPMTRQERAEWLWDLCADASQSQAMCYRSHYRTAINENTDLMQLESDIQG